MNNSTIIYVGAIISAIGTTMVIIGNLRFTREIEHKQSMQLISSVEDIKNNIKTISKDQIEQITRTLTNEQAILVIINNLTTPEKWTLVRFVKGYQALKKEDKERMLSCLNDYYSKFPSEAKEDVFESLNRKRLIKHKVINLGVAESELTPPWLTSCYVDDKKQDCPF